MMTVDGILATGRYTDRRGRLWEKRIRWSTSSGLRMWSHLYRLEPLLGGHVYRIIDENQMRLLIERDLHRDECEGLPWCGNHPVPSVFVCHEPGEPWGQFKVRAHDGATVFRAFPEAMDAARALAVGG